MQEPKVPNNQRHYIVDCNIDGGNQYTRFIDDGVWEIGSDYGNYEEIINGIKANDTLYLKAKASDQTTLKIVAYGIVEENLYNEKILHDGRRLHDGSVSYGGKGLKVKWYLLGGGVDIEGVNYNNRAIEEISDADLSLIEGEIKKVLNDTHSGGTYDESSQKSIFTNLKHALSNKENDRNLEEEGYTCQGLIGWLSGNPSIGKRLIGMNLVKGGFNHYLYSDRVNEENLSGFKIINQEIRGRVYTKEELREDKDLYTHFWRYHREPDRGYEDYFYCTNPKQELIDQGGYITVLGFKDYYLRTKPDEDSIPLYVYSNHPEVRLFETLPKPEKEAGSEDDQGSEDNQKEGYEQVITKQIFFGESIEPQLGAEKLAESLWKIIHFTVEQEGGETSQEDRFFGIFGQWGRGKTYLWKLVKGDLKTAQKKFQVKYIPVEFHAWKYQDTPAVWAYLYETLSEEYYSKEKWVVFKPIHSLCNAFKSLWLSFFRDFNQVALFLTALSGFIILIAFIGPRDLVEDFGSQSNWLLGLGGGALLATIVGAYRSFSRPLVAHAKEFIKKYGQRQSFKIHLGLQHEIQQELVHLLRAWTYNPGINISEWKLPFTKRKLFLRKRIILFIDDIDRCSHEKIVEIVDSIRVMLNNKQIQDRLIVVAAIDEWILGSAIQLKYLKYKEGEKDDSLIKLSAEYFDKLFLVGIKLKDLLENEKKEILDAYLKDLVSSPRESKDDSGKSTNTAEENTYIIRDTNNNTDENQIPPSSMSSSDKEQPRERVITNEVDNQIVIEEKEFLLEFVQELKNATPRNIRNYSIRYRLARSLFELGLSSIERGWNFDSKKILAKWVLKQMNFERSDYSEFKGSEEIKKLLIQAVEMVDYYPKNLVLTGEEAGNS